MTVRKGLARGVSPAAMMAGIAMTLPGGASAQGVPASDGTVTTLPTVDVQAQAPANTLRRAAPVNRMPGSVQDTPQTINVIPREVLEQQNVTTLEEALRNVPGITVSIGEGNGGVNGDQIRIRGFSAQNDIYVDGLRDFGAYQRDAFTYEDVSVIKGPSGFAFGTGSVGGAVAIGSRTPHLGNSYGGNVTGGMGPFARGTLDLNQQIGESTAIRLNIMGQSSRTVDRDTPNGTRWGVAPSIAFGLGTNTTFSVEYVHYEYDVPSDAGIPVITPQGQTIGRPATEYGLPRSTWYGSMNDRDQVQVDRVTARLNHEANDWLTISNDTRATWVDRDFAYAIPGCDAACATSFVRGGNPAVTPSGAGNPYSQQSWAIQNVTTATARFTTGPLRHELTGGIDIWHEDTDRTGYGYTTTRVTSMRPTDQDLQRALTGASNKRHGETTAYGAFLADRVWLLPELSILGGVRVTRYEVEYTAGTPGQPLTSNLSGETTSVDPRAALIWQPTPQQTYYASYSTSSTPPGSLFFTQPSTVGGFRDNYDPERNTIYELGGKVSLLPQDRLGVYGAIFRIEKENAQDVDPLTGIATLSSDEQRNQGAEIGITGRITPAWTINANYTYMDSETRSSGTAANVGKRVQYVPEHAAALWTSYEINRNEPWNLTLGGGFTWRDKVYLNAANTAQAPQNFSIDLMASHRINDSLRVQVNGYNMTDERNYNALFGTRVLPSPGRTVLVSVNAEF
ncbi:TonB-dependent siderophore receptor [Roseomonas aerophila]|uniref:TonB-dependent siderophore receptor n=1 Tax=Teichococcus aerophilus TaxID=1224513 RepID=A0ABR7RQB8_9PROT|nr:TonB-dependent siderophore receptor [Pseudoroseomonas aerophila]MBC9208804.1 TonB-dependent siderophore receptor [Pseudoroseomonas aerophila]